MKYSYLSRQRGLALIMAVLIAALAVTAIAFAAWRQQVRLRSVEVRSDSAQAQLLLRASITIARTALIDDLRADQNSGSSSDDPREELFTHREDTDVEKGHASGYIEDASGRFNLNEIRDSNGSGSNGINTYWFDAYQRLLAQLSLDPELAFALADWLDSDDQVLPGGAEDMYYLAQDPPHRAGNRDLSDLSELLQIKGYTPQVLAKLRPHVDVFPVDSPGQGSLNINFCSPEVLSAMINVLSKSEAITLLQEVRQQPYLNFNDFYVRLPKDIQNRIANINGLQGVLQNQLTTQSSFFYAILQLDYGQVHWSERVLLRRISRDKTAVIRRVRLPD